MEFDLTRFEEEEKAPATPLAQWFVRNEQQKAITLRESQEREEAAQRAVAAAERAAAAAQRAAAAAQRAAALNQTVTSTLDGAQQNLQDLRDTLFDQLRSKQATPAF